MQEVYRKKHESKHRTWLSSMRAVCFHVGLEPHLVRNLELSECHLVLRKWQVLEPCWNSDLGMRLNCLWACLKCNDMEQFLSKPFDEGHSCCTEDRKSSILCEATNS